MENTTDVSVSPSPRGLIEEVDGAQGYEWALILAKAQTKLKTDKADNMYCFHFIHCFLPPFKVSENIIFDFRFHIKSESLQLKTKTGSENATGSELFHVF